MEKRPKGGRFRAVPRIIFVAIAAAAMYCGYRGLEIYLSHPPAGANLGQRWQDAAYYDLQLFALGSDAVNAGPPFNVWLDLGRFLAAATLVYGLTLAALQLFGASWRKLINRLRRGHVVVVGTGTEATAIAAFLRQTAGPSGRRYKVVPVDDGDEASLRSVGIRKAAMLVACADDNGTSVMTARTARRIRGRGEFVAHALVRDPGLALVLRAQEIASSDAGGHPMYIYTLDELAARHHIAHADFSGPQRPRLLVVGASTFGRSIIIEFARRWHTAPGLAGKVEVTLIDDDAEAVIEELKSGWPFIVRVLDLTANSDPLRKALPTISRPPTRSYFCSDDEEIAQRGAIAAAAQWQPGPQSVVVRLSQLSPSGQKTTLLQEEGSGTLDVVTVPQSAAQALCEMEDATLVLARTVHERYVADSRQRGVGAASQASLVPWKALSADLQRANIAQAKDFPSKLRQIRCTVAPRSGFTDQFSYREGEIDLLAAHEHERWMKERKARGWRYGPERDNARKIHPMMLEWEKLPTAMRNIDRDMVREVPLEYDPVLELDGLQIVRLASMSDFEPIPVILDDVLTPEVLDELARSIHARYVASENAKFTAPNDSMLPWDQLTEDLRESNRAQARDIGTKLDSIRAFATKDAPETPFEFSDQEIELLSVAEHDRWMRQRFGAGWKYAPVRDNDLLHHPMLVPWSAMQEDDKEKDRNAVRDIPGILAGAGLYIARRPKVDKL